MKLAFVGGGTLGPVTPLLATARAMRRLAPKAEIVWIGTPTGPERSLIENAGFTFLSLPIVKLPRYPSITWLTFPFAWARVRRLATALVDQLKLDGVVTAGGFTAVPLVFAAAQKKIPCATHQLDVEPGLANRKIAKLCRSVTTSFEYERAPFGDWVADERIPTPTRYAAKDLPAKTKALEMFGLSSHKPVVFVFGGGTGAQALNEFVARTKRRWSEFTQLIHMTGVDRGESVGGGTGYAVHQFLDEKQMAAAYAAADLVICRAGMGALSEIAALKKAAILVPIPHSHQESNARAFEESGAVIIVEQTEKNFDDGLLTAAKLLLNDPKARLAMGEQAHAFLPTDDGMTLVKRILATVKL